MTFRIFDDRGRHIKTHRLSIEQRACELSRIVAFEPGRRISDQRKTRRMTFGKTIFAEAANLLEDAFGKFHGDAFCLHACDQSFAMALHSTGAVPRRHVTAELVRLAWSIIGGHHGKAHHLLLKQRHAEGFFQHRLQRLGVDNPCPLCLGGGVNRDAPCRP